MGTEVEGVSGVNHFQIVTYVASSRPKPKPKKKEPIDILIEKAAELDRGARQYNPLYKLESVYVDTDAYELVYEFQALKSINRLNKKAMEMGAEGGRLLKFDLNSSNVRKVLISIIVVYELRKILLRDRSSPRYLMELQC